MISIVVPTLITLSIVLCSLPYVCRLWRRSKFPSPKGAFELPGPQQARSSPEKGIEFDIIAVHGLGAHSANTWTRKAPKVEIERRLKDGFNPEDAKRINWLRSFIPNMFPKARTIYFGHNADWFFMAPFKTSQESAKSLLQSITRLRKDTNDRRPIIFIAHSFGGIIVKDALIMAKIIPEFKQISDATCGIIFLGTPYQGSHISWMGVLLAQMTALVFGSNKVLLKSLQYHASELADKQLLFSHSYGNEVKLYCFYETLPTFLLGISLGRVVDRTSASLEHKDITNWDLDKDHSGLNKFSSEGDPAYLRICEAIKGILENAEVSSYLHSCKRKELMESTIKSCRTLAISAEKDMEELQLRRNDIRHPSSVKYRIDWFLQSHQYRAWCPWADTNVRPTQFLWYTGRRGIGKTDALISVTRELSHIYRESSTLDVVYFFCNVPAETVGTNIRSSTSTVEILRSLIAQLVNRDPKRCNSLSDDDQERLQSIFNPVLDLSAKAFWSLAGSLLRSRPQRRVHIIIDGLEAIEPEEDRISFVHALRGLWQSLVSEPAIEAKILVASLPYAPICDAFVDLPSVDPLREVTGCLELLKPLARNPRQDNIVDAQEGTGEWINEEYLKWIEKDRPNILLLSGKAGSGKSTLLLKLLTKTLDEHGLPRLTSLLAQNLGGYLSPESYGTLEVKGTGQRANTVSTGKVIVASFFYSSITASDMSHKQMLASLLFQLLSQDERLFSLFRDVYLSIIERQKSSPNRPENAFDDYSWKFEELKDIFLSIVKADHLPMRIFVFIDAIDESEETSLRGEILELLTIARSNGSPNVVLKSVVTGRHFDLPAELTIDVHTVVVESHSGKDIERVVDTGLIRIKDAIASLEETERNEYDLRKFRSELLERAKGVFLWTSLVLKLVENLIRDTLIPPNEMMQKLDTLPDDLEKLYETIVFRLKQRDEIEVEKGKQWLKWVAFAERFLDIKEFREAVAITWLSSSAVVTKEIWRGQRMPTSNLAMLQRALTTTCGGFLELKYAQEIPTTNPRIKLKIRSDDQALDVTIQLLHWTVKKFLKDDKASPFNASKPHGDRQITNACIRYLKLSFSPDNMPDTINLKNSVNGVKYWGQEEYETYVKYLEALPLLHYALAFLPNHLEGVGTGLEAEMELVSEILETLMREPRLPGLYIMSSWVHQVHQRSKSNNGELVSHRPNTVKNVSHQYWETKFEQITSLPNEQKDFCTKFLTTALVTAATRGYTRTVRVLVTAGASGTAIDKINLSTALEAAARYNHSKIVDFLTQNQFNTPPGGGALSTATKDVEIELPFQNLDGPRGKSLDSALQVATKRGNTTIVSSLLNKGASSDSRDALGRSPVHLAAAQGRASAVDILLKSGADIDSKDIHGQTPLWQAAANGHEEVVLLLLNAGANIESKDRSGTTALSAASSAGHEAVVRQLLNWGAKDGHLKTNTKSMFMVPFDRHSFFIGRVEILRHLDRLVWENKDSENHSTALVGLGGIGKTQIAIEFAYRSQEIHPDLSIFWVTASSHAQLEQDFRHIARRARLPGWSELNVDVLNLVSAWLKSPESGHWLLTLDNADELDALFSSQGQSLLQYIPRSSNGHIIVTSRDRRIALKLCNDSNIITVSPLPVNGAIDMLEKAIGVELDRLHSSRLVQALDCLPLAISQASAFISQNQITVQEYYQLFKDSEFNAKELLREDFTDPRRGLQSINSVSATLAISFGVIAKESPQSAALLSLASFFAPNNIPEYLLREQHQSKSSFTKIVRILIEFSVISVHTESDSYEMHPLVQQCAKVWLELQHSLKDWQGMALKRIAANYPKGNYETWERCAELLPHAEMILSYDFNDESSTFLYSSLLQKTGAYLYGLGRYHQALKRIERALQGFRRTLGNGNLQTLECLNLFIRVFRSEGRYNEAEIVTRKAVSEIESALGQEHSLTLSSLNNLAGVLRDQGKYEEAEQMHRHVLMLRETVLGKMHPDTLTSMNNLAIVLSSQGKDEEGEQIHRQLLMLREEVLGKDHPDTLASMNNLANVLSSQGKDREAENMHRKVLKLRETAFGNEHPSTLASMNNLAMVLRNQGKYEKAEHIHRQVLSLQKTVLGQYHPDTLGSMNNLAVVLTTQGKYDEAEQIHRQELLRSEEAFGKEHPSTLTSMDNLARVLRDQGKYEEAEPMHRQVLMLLETVLGKEHPDTLASMNNLAIVLTDQGKYEEGEQMHRQVLQLREMVLGKDHPDTLASMNNLATVLTHQGKYEEAEQIHRQVLSVQKTVLGKDHPDTLASMDNLAVVLSQILNSSVQRARSP